MGKSDQVEMRVADSRIYRMASEGVASFGGGLPSEEDNYLGMNSGNYTHEARCFSARREIEVSEIRDFMLTSGGSYFIDLAVCKSSRVSADLPGDASVLDASVLENLIRDVGNMGQVGTGNMVLVVTSAEDRTKDSRHIEDRCGVIWTYIADPAVALLGLVPGEEAFTIDRAEVVANEGVKRAQFVMNGIKGNFLTELVRGLKRSLHLAADPNSYDVSKTY